MNYKWTKEEYIKNYIICEQIRNDNYIPEARLKLDAEKAWNRFKKISPEYCEE